MNLNEKVIIDELDALKFADEGDKIDVTILFELGEGGKIFFYMKVYEVIDTFQWNYELRMGFCYGNCNVGISVMVFKKLVLFQSLGCLLKCIYLKTIKFLYILIVYLCMNIHLYFINNILIRKSENNI